LYLDLLLGFIGALVPPATLVPDFEPRARLHARLFSFTEVLFLFVLRHRSLCRLLYYTSFYLHMSHLLSPLALLSLLQLRHTLFTLFITLCRYLR
jgi:hypothetical protein